MPQSLSPQAGRHCRTCFYLICAFALFFLTFTTAVVAQPDPAPGDPSKTEKQKDAPDLQSSEAEENLHLIMQEGLSESSQLVPVSEEEIDDAREAEQPRDEAEPGIEEEEKETVPLGPEARPIEKALTKTGKLVELSRRPFIFLEQKVPFFAKRNILFFGRLEVDVVNYGSGILRDDSGVAIHRFRQGLAGHVKFWQCWNYKLEVDLTDGESTLSDAYIVYRTQRWGAFRIGNQKVAQTLSGQTSSVSIPFMERPLPVLAFTLQRRLGIGWDTHLRKLGANITVFYKDPNENIGSSGYAARFYFNPVRFRGDVVHIGASFMDLKLENDGRFRARPESNRTNIRLVDTGVRPDVKKQDAFGLELAGALGPLTIRSEFYSTGWSREFLEDTRFNGWYVEGSWFLTGETANYRDGKFIRPVVKGERGAWEVAARLSSLDLNDKDVLGVPRIISAWASTGTPEPTGASWGT
jgi:phosphate-selective porin OprO/OprP